MEAMEMTRRTALSLAVTPFFAHGAKGEHWAYFGTYTRGDSKGIYVSKFETATGKLSPPELAAEVVNPSFLAIHPNRKFLYAVSEIANFKGEKSGAVSAYQIDAKTGKLSAMNQVSSKGTGACHLNVDKTGRTLVVVNYGTGSTASFAVGKDGKLSEAVSAIQHSGSSVDSKRQQGPHAHSINYSPDNRFAMVADLGLDQVLVYRVDAAKSTLTPNDPPFVKVKSGGGPRHFHFHPNGRWAYTNLEMASAVTAFSYDKARGVLTELQTISTLPNEVPGNSTAECLVHPSGKFVYVSNRGHDSIAGFSVDPAKGTLTAISHTSTQGKVPRNFRIDPSGAYLLAANQNTNNVVVFKIDQGSGSLTPTGQSLDVPIPVCIRFVPVG